MLTLIETNLGKNLNILTLNSGIIFLHDPHSIVGIENICKRGCPKSLIQTAA
jgi:hypothetical protein